MPRGLHRYFGAHHLHFITCSCYRRLPRLRSARSRDRLLAVLEQTRQRYRFVVVGYVVMPEHIHLLISEPEVGTHLDGHASLEAHRPCAVAEEKAPCFAPDRVIWRAS
jgi:REP element-mobilizing transposase RayT